MRRELVGDAVDLVTHRGWICSGQDTVTLIRSGILRLTCQATFVLGSEGI